MKKIILLARVFAVGLAGTASAADLAVEPVVYTPAFTWTGCYLGINGGWIGSDESYETSLGSLVPGAVPFGPNATQADVDLLRRSFSSDESGETAGGQFGCQWQLGAVVLGGEWDWNWSGLEENNNANFGEVPLVSNPVVHWPARVEHHHKQLDWFMTARARLGWTAWDRLLIYATGGLAVGAYDAFTNVPSFNDGIPGLVYNGAYREKRVGYIAGGGFEWAFANNWTAKAEFLYLDFGSFDYISPVSDLNEGRNTAWRTHVDAQEYVVRVGLNYLFHLGGLPVVARY
ncbi:MAG: hypothetical protein WB822_12480 [Rhodoplanes sp.]